MATCQDVITRALRKLNALPLGATVSTLEAQNALIVLQSLYMELVGWGAFGRENDLLAKGDWTACPNQRVRLVDPNASVQIPDQLPIFPPWWNEGAWGWDAWIYWPVWPTSPTTCLKAPDDLSVVTIVDPTNNTNYTFIYDAFVGRWGPLNNLALQTEAPLSRRWQEPLSNELALRLMVDYGSMAGGAPPPIPRGGWAAMCSRFGTHQRPTRSDYF